MESLPEVVPIGGPDGEGDEDTSGQPLQPLRRSRRLALASRAKRAPPGQPLSPSAYDPQAGNGGGPARGEHVQNNVEDRPSFVQRKVSDVHEGEEAPSGSRPPHRPSLVLRIRQSKADAGLLVDGLEQPQIQHQPDFIALEDSDANGGDDAQARPLRRSARLREAGGDAAHPWRHRRLQKLISRRAAFQPKQRLSKSKRAQGEAAGEELWLRMYAASHKSINLGPCSLCSRTIHNITAHHVHPRVDGERRGPDGFTPEQLQKHVPVCLSCHRMIHHIIPNDIMGRSYYSVEMLRAHPQVMAWISWVTRQPVPKPPEVTAVNVPNLSRRQIKEAKRQGKQSINQGTKRPVNNLTHPVRIELEKIWNENGNTFPKWSRGKDSPRSRRLELVQRLEGRIASKPNIPTLRRAFKVIPTYREWYLWLFDDTRRGRPAAKTPKAPRAVTQPQENVDVEVADAQSIPGVADVISGAVDDLAGAVEVIDLTGASPGADGDDGWVDVGVVEEVQERIVIDLTGDDSGEVNQAE